MKALAWTIGIFVLSIVLAGLWLTRDSWHLPLPGASAPRGDSKLLVEKLKNLYEKQEEAENKIRISQTARQTDSTGQRELLAVRDSIEVIRARIADKADVTPAREIENSGPEPVHRKWPKISVPVAAASAGAVLFIGVLGWAIRRRAFGKAPKGRPFPPFTSMGPALPPAPKEKPVLPARPAFSTPDRTEDAGPLPEEKPFSRAPAPPASRSSTGSSNEEILHLHAQGLSVKDISSRMKIEQDQIRLALRLHGKQPK